MTIAHWTPRPDWKGSQAFYDAYAKKFGEAPDFLDSALAWMSLEILQSAVAQAPGSTRRRSAQIIATDTFETINGKVNFDGVQNVITPTAFVQYQKGKLQIVWPKSSPPASTSRRRAGDRPGRAAPCRRSSTRCCPGQLLFAALVTGSLYALVALGLNLVYGTLRMLNVAHGDVVMLGAYGAYWAFSLARRVAARRRAGGRRARRRSPGSPSTAASFRRLFATAGAGVDPARGQLAAPLLRPLDHPAERRRARLHAERARPRLLDRGLPPRQRGDDRQPARGARGRRRDLHRRRRVPRPQPRSACRCAP